MKKNLLLLISLVFMTSGTAIVCAAPLRDVPPGHWAAPAVRSVVGKKIMSAQPNGNFQGSKPVTRYELAVALDRFIRYIEAGRKPLHSVAPQANVPISSNASPSVKSAIAHLVKGGFIPSTSPLFRGNGSETVTAQQLSNALAQVTIRLSDRSLPPMKD